MDAQQIASLISTVGFPIVCCGAMFWFIVKTLKGFTDEMRQILSKLSDTIDKNTESTDKLVTTVEIISKIGSGKDG